MRDPEFHSALIALGSNLGDRPVNIRDALARLAAGDSIRIGRVSTLLDNPAVGGPTGSPPFLNAVAMIDTSLPPAPLMHRLLDVESAMGRVRVIRWGPRLIDLDLLLYGDAIIHNESLTLPHPLLHTRPFVLGPLAEIAPDAVHPVFKRAVGELWDELRHGSG